MIKYNQNIGDVVNNDLVNKAQEPDKQTFYQRHPYLVNGITALSILAASMLPNCANNEGIAGTKDDIGSKLRKPSTRQLLLEYNGDDRLKEGRKKGGIEIPKGTGKTLDYNLDSDNNNKWTKRGKWTKKDTAYQLTFTALTLADWGQTRHTAQNPDKFYEKNPILGKHPSTGKVDLYFASCILGHSIISYLLPEKPRRIWQNFWIAIESYCVISNNTIGVKIDF